MPGPGISLAKFRALAGKEIGVSRWLEIDQQRIDAFAETTLDRQFIHIDPAAAEKSIYGGTIAHGFLTLSLLSVMAQEVLPSIEGARATVNYGMDRVRFVAPVRSGRRIRGRFVMTAVTDRSPGVVQAALSVTVEIENEAKPALAAEWLVLFHV